MSQTRAFSGPLICPLLAFERCILSCTFIRTLIIIDVR